MHKVCDKYFAVKFLVTFTIVLQNFVGYTQRNDAPLKRIGKLYITDVQEAYQYSKFLRLSTNRPEIGKEIQFVYTGAFSRTLTPHLTIYYEKNGKIEWKTLKTQKRGETIIGTFILPDSIKAFSIKPRNNLKDTAEAFTFNVYQQKRLLKGSLAAAAKFYYTNRAFNGVDEPDKARDLLMKEFQINPGLKKDNLLLYYQTGIKYPNERIRTQLKKTWDDSLKRDHDETFLTDLYRLTLRFQRFDESKAFRIDLLAKYPKGMLAFQEAEKQLNRSHNLEISVILFSPFQTKVSILILPNSCPSFSSWYSPCPGRSASIN